MWRRWLFRLAVVVMGLVLLGSTLAWADAALLGRHTALLLVRRPWAVQVLLRERAVSATLFSSRYFPAAGLKVHIDRNPEHSESDGIDAQREPSVPPMPGAWGIDRGRFVLAGGWGDPAGRHNLVGVRLPLWFLMVVSAVALLLMGVHGRRRARLRAGCCRACGYDLRGSTGSCPECGSAR